MAGSPCQWPPLLNEVLAEITSADSLVRWGRDAWGLRKVVGLRELRVVALLFACSQEGADEQWRGLLNAEFDEEEEFDFIGGRWVCRRASLMDLALRFGQADLARHLLDFGLEQRMRLQPQDLQCLPAPSLAGLPVWRRLRGAEARHLEELPVHDLPKWSGSKEDALRRWYPAAEFQGWAPDWDADVQLARLLVDAPATRAALVLASEGVRVDLSEEAESRLLDAALLLGDPGAAAALAGHGGQQPPMRAWEGLHLHSCIYHRGQAEYAEAFLRAGQYGVLAAELGNDSEEEPARKALRAAARAAVQTGSVSLAQAVRGAAGAAPPQLEFGLPGKQLVDRKAYGGAAHAGRQEFEVCRAKLEVLEALGASGAGCTAEVRVEGEWVDVPVLFLAMLLGDESAATRLVRAGHSFLRLGLDGAGLLAADLLRFGQFEGVGLPAGRLETAERTLGLFFAVAARRCLAALAATGSCFLEGQTGLLVRVAGFVGPVWSEGDERVRQEVNRLTGRDPLATYDPWPGAAAVRAAAVQPPREPSTEAHTGASEEGAAADQPAGPAAEPASELQGLPSGGQPASSSAEPARRAAGAEDTAPEKDLAEALQGEQEDVHRVLLMSKMEKEDTELAFNDHVYALLRLTKNQREISEHLLAWEGLWPCRQRVEEAGCELQPDWAGGALLLVPMTPELYFELCLELKGHHVLMLQSDVHLLEVAVRAMPSRGRPQVKRDHRADRYEGQEAFRSEGSPSEVPAEEDVEQEGGEASGSASEADVAGRGVAKDEDRLCRYGIVKERIHLPANNFDLPVAMPKAVTKSDPANTSHQGEGAQERRQQPGLHEYNPRLFGGSKPAEG